MSNAELQNVLVVGGGMVGGTVAALLARCGITVTVLDAGSKVNWDTQAPVGLRVSALAPGSVAILEAAGAWELISASRHCPYRRMRVEDGQGSGVLEFEAASFAMERLGTLTENDLVVHALQEVLERMPGVEMHYEAGVERLEQDANSVSCTLEDGRRFTGQLLLACDGANSRVRRELGIARESWEYNQSGVVGLVRKQQPNPGVAWQRFLPGGPLALLPLADGWSSMVWSMPTREAQAMLAMDDDEFRRELDAASDGWLGQVEALGPRGAFPLSMSLSGHYLDGRVALLGDAAHVVHPLAGQGVNLGLADAAALVETLMAAPHGAVRALQQWERWRRSESALMARGVHALGYLFRPQALSLPRALGMRMVQGNWFIREAFLQRAAGRGPNAPRLALGEGLQALGTVTNAAKGARHDS